MDVLRSIGTAPDFLVGYAGLWFSMLVALPAWWYNIPH
jgi:hypothetical protein